MWHEISSLVQKGNLELAEKKFSGLKGSIKEENMSNTLLKYEILILLAESQFTLVKNKIESFFLQNPESSNDLIIIAIKNMYIEALWRLNFLENALVLAEELKKYFEETNTDDIINFNDQYSYVLYNLSRIYVYLADYKIAEEYAQDSLNLRTKYSSKFDQAEVLNVLGIINGYAGKPDEAIKYYKHSLAIRRELGNERLIAYTINNIGENYRLKGEEAKALNSYLECYEICSKLEDKQGMRLGLIGSASINLSQTKFEKALDDCQKCLTLFDENASPFHTIEMLFQTIRLKLLLHKDYKNELEQVYSLGKKFSDKTITFYTKMTQAFILKENTRIRTKLKAQELFEEILSEDYQNIEYVILAMQSLVELYLIELQISNDTTILEDINKLLSRMHELAKQQNFFPLMIKTIILQSRFALLNNKIDNCFEILDEAELLIKDKHLTGFSLLLDQERVFINEQISKWKTLVDSNASMYQKIQESHLLHYLQDIEKLVNETSDKK